VSNASDDALKFGQSVADSVSDTLSKAADDVKKTTEDAVNSVSNFFGGLFG